MQEIPKDTEIHKTSGQDEQGVICMEQRSSRTSQSGCTTTLMRTFLK